MDGDAREITNSFNDLIGTGPVNQAGPDVYTTLFPGKFVFINPCIM